MAEHALEISLNTREGSQEIRTPSTQSWTNWENIPLSLPLKQGFNVLTLSLRSPRGPVIDHIKIISLQK
jgi:hypothetical protein